jgi:Fic family protein
MRLLMTAFDPEILPIGLLDKYLTKVDTDIQIHFDNLIDSELSAGTFSFYTSVSAVFSSKIEGEDIELDSFIKHKKWDVKFLPDHTQKIDDLYEAYQFAQKNKLTEATVEQSHILLTQHILQQQYRGKIRTGNMFVTTSDGKIEYVACLPDKVGAELNKLYNDIASLINTELTIAETFFFASLIHLVFVKIHPFDDGNGRTARLIEKWFLAQKLEDKAWYLQSEKYYYNQHQTYYKNIRMLGLEYELLDYSKALPFLLMLAQVLTVDQP